jgi:hypothetical protein
MANIERKSSTAKSRRMVNMIKVRQQAKNGRRRYHIPLFGA